MLMLHTILALAGKLTQWVRHPETFHKEHGHCIQLTQVINQQTCRMIAECQGCGDAGAPDQPGVLHVADC